MARSHGFLDPIALYARLQTFTRPSEVAEPVELLRAGAVFHARGLLNARVVQHNLDWVWPFWIERQFDPADQAFVPRAFSLTHVNLTHRSWTAIGLPGRDDIPIVDPRGLLTPHWDGWSLDVWCVDDHGNWLLPSRTLQATQTQRQDDQLATVTCTSSDGMALQTIADVVTLDGQDRCRLRARTTLASGGFVVLALRPCNPEGVARIDEVNLVSARDGWRIGVDGAQDEVHFDRPADRHHASRYDQADVYVHLDDRQQTDHALCPQGMATAAAMFRVEPDAPFDVQASVALRRTDPTTATGDAASRSESWTDALADAASLSLPDARCMRLYQAALRTLVLCTPDDTVAGPYTYRRYWYRDAVFIGHGLLCANLVKRAGHIAERFPERQDRHGYCHSQEGEWDANGEVLWFVDRLASCTNTLPDERLVVALDAAARWIDDKRRPGDGSMHAGLLPAGFSAEHLGPNDHYYWDALWSVAGLKSASRLAARRGDRLHAERWQVVADELFGAIERALLNSPAPGGGIAIAAAPGRRLDAGAIGSVAMSYPLALCAPHDRRMAALLEYLQAQCFHAGGFFQDMIHSGVNAYLSLHVAQALLRAGDERFAGIVRTVRDLASATGHWPEAVHPHTGGGCMGDGHHAWAAAEWIAMMRSAFVREEGDVLVLASGLLPEWLEARQEMHFGPTPTAFGSIEIHILPPRDGDDERAPCNDCWRVRWSGDWHDKAPALRIELPGSEHVDVAAGGARHDDVLTQRKASA